MIKYYCDHCGKEILGPGVFEVASREPFGSFDPITGQLCYDCNVRLCRFITRAEELRAEELRAEELEEEAEHE